MLADSQVAQLFRKLLWLPRIMDSFKQSCDRCCEKFGFRQRRDLSAHIKLSWLAPQSSTGAFLSHRDKNYSFRFPGHRFERDPSKNGKQQHKWEWRTQKKIIFEILRKLHFEIVDSKLWRYSTKHVFWSLTVLLPLNNKYNNVVHCVKAIVDHTAAWEVHSRAHRVKINSM